FIMDNPTSSLSRPSSDYDDTLDDLLLIRDLASNPAWLNDNQALVQRTIADGLRVPTLHLDTITTIADLLTAALAQGDRDDWFGSIAVAVAAWDVPPSSQFCIGFRAVIADFYRHIATYADRD